MSGTPEWGRVSDPPPTAGSCQLGASWRGVAWIHAVGNGVGVECLIAVPRIRLGSSDNEGSTPDKVTPLRAWGPLAVTLSRPLLLISRSENFARRIQADHRPDGTTEYCAPRRPRRRRRRQRRTDRRAVMPITQSSLFCESPVRRAEKRHANE